MIETDIKRLRNRFAKNLDQESISHNILIHINIFYDFQLKLYA